MGHCYLPKIKSSLQSKKEKEKERERKKEKEKKRKKKKKSEVRKKPDVLLDWRKFN